MHEYVTDLARVVWEASRADEGTISAIGAQHVARAVDAWLAKQGVVYPQIIGSEQELAALPVGSVIRCLEDPEASGLRVAERRPAGWAFAFENSYNTSREMAIDSLPAMVLFVGQD